MKTLNPIRADIIALDAQDRPVLLIGVKARPQENIYDRQQLVDDLREAGHVLPYAMLVTLEDVRIFRWDGAALSELLHLPTADALSFYDPEYRSKTIYNLSCVSRHAARVNASTVKKTFNSKPRGVTA